MVATKISCHVFSPKGFFTDRFFFMAVVVSLEAICPALLVEISSNNFWDLALF